MIRIVLKYKLESVNVRLGWCRGKKIRVAKSERKVACLVLSRYAPPPLPILVTITRIGKRNLDSDNLVGAAKHIRDGIADWLGVDDGDPRIVWEVRQIIGKRYETIIEVEAKEIV